MYTADLNKLVEGLGLRIHSFADDNNIYMGFKPIDELSCSILDLERCVDCIRRYMSENYLKINITKTQILFCGRPTTLGLYDMRLDEFEKKLEMECSRNKYGKTLGVKLDENLKFDEMIIILNSEGTRQCLVSSKCSLASSHVCKREALCRRA